MKQKEALSLDKINQYRQGAVQRYQARLQQREDRRLTARQAARQAIAAIIPLYRGVRRVYLFGSITRPGAFKAGSDIDLAVEGVDMALCFDIWRDMERLLPDWSLDVRSLNNDDLFAARIRQKGELIYEQSIQSP